MESLTQRGFHEIKAIRKLYAFVTKTVRFWYKITFTKGNVASSFSSGSFTSRVVAGPIYNIFLTSETMYPLLK